MQQLKETIIDYGQTLKSIQPDEYIYISVSISSSGWEIPDRVYLEVKKSVLQALDRGTVTREKVIEQIDVRGWWFGGQEESTANLSNIFFNH